MASPKQPERSIFDSVKTLVKREKMHLNSEEPRLSESEVASLKRLDMLHSTSDAAVFLTPAEIDELEKEELLEVQEDNDNTKKGEEKTSWFNTLSSLISTSSPSTGDFLAQITLGIQLATKSSAKYPPGRVFNHTLHQFENPKFNMNFDVKEYCAGAFKEIRENLYGISAVEYVNEWTLPEEQLSAAEGAGKSGALFCFSKSKKFIFKTIFRSEVETLINAIKAYHKHCNQQPNTLIMRMLGVYCFSRASLTSTETYVLVFGNVNWSGVENAYPIHEVFDLKGRRTKTLRFHDEEGDHEKGVRKDKHLSRLFYAGDYRSPLLTQLANDVALLQKHNLMDYSLLVGVHHCTEEEKQELKACPDHPASMGKSKFREYKGGFHANGEIYFVGIIDCLTFYGAAKKVAHSFKSLLWSKEQLSTVQAQFYAERFLLYMEDIFPGGDQPSVDPFMPCAATNMEEDLTMVIQGVQQVFKKSATPCQLFTTKDYQEVIYHNVQVKDTSLRVKEYTPSLFARLRVEWNCDPDFLSNDLALPILQIQATSMHITDETGAIKGTNIPSNSKRYLIETLQQRDVHMLFSFLKSYVTHIIDNPDSFIVKIVGLFKCSLNLLNWVYVVVMENAEYVPGEFTFVGSRLYSLQGTKVQQPTPNRDAISSSRPTLYLDRNLDRTFRIGQQQEEFLAIIKRDVEFLKSNQMILYSLIITVGKLVADNGEPINNETLQDIKRGLCESPFGEYNLLGCITNIWRKYGKRDQVSSLSSIITRTKQEAMSVTDPQYYGERFFDMASSVLTK